MGAVWVERPKPHPRVHPSRSDDWTSYGVSLGRATQTTSWWVGLGRSTETTFNGGSTWRSQSSKRLNVVMDGFGSSDRNPPTRTWIPIVQGSKSTGGGFGRATETRTQGGPHSSRSLNVLVGWTPIVQCSERTGGWFRSSDRNHAQGGPRVDPGWTQSFRVLTLSSWGFRSSDRNHAPWWTPVLHGFGRTTQTIP